jgi:hypothetical protein
MGLKLIGAGLGRTGTLSIKLALEQLGLGPCYHMIELFMNPSHAPLWVRAAEGNPDWDRIFDGYGATVDYPGCSFWRELAQFYPDAKVLLSIRDPDAWFESTQATILSAETVQSTSVGPLRDFFGSTVLRDLGERVHDRDFLIEYFTRHNSEVQRAIPPERLLVYSAAQGWEPLCRFLGVSIPDKPFPRANTREQYAERRAEVTRDGRAQFDPATLGDRVRERLARMREES